MNIILSDCYNCDCFINSRCTNSDAIIDINEALVDDDDDYYFEEGECDFFISTKRRKSINIDTFGGFSIIDTFGGFSMMFVPEVRP